MLHAAAWYLLLTLIGWISLPLSYRLLPFLQERGVTLLRPLGLLLWSFIFWLLTSLQLLQNTVGGLLAALFLLAALSVWAGWKRWGEIFAFIKQQRSTVLLVEGLTLLAFTAWALVRAANPDIQFTEKTMEMAFISGITRSINFPPLDPWLSGYSISYYHFGYVMVASLAKLSGTPGPIAFNLAHASWFAMSAAGAFGIVYNLLARFFTEASAGIRRWALLAPLFLLIVSNLEGFLGVLHARGLFWEPASSGGYSSTFWTWLGIPDLNQPPLEPFGWMPHRGTWDPSWRASRVLVDTRFDGQTVEIIDEFPFFSYLLGDLHPHVLSMPFVLMAIALALNFYLSRLDQKVPLPGWLERVKSAEFWLAAVALGALAFLNTWDFPFYVALYAGGGALAAAGGRPGNISWKPLLRDFILTGVLVGIAGGILYLPFYLGFSSQAGGILPSMVFHTPGKNFWIMFAPLLLPLMAGLWFFHRLEHPPGIQAGLKTASVILLALLLGSLLFGTGLIALGGIGEQLAAGGSTSAATIGQTLARAGHAFQVDVQGAGGASTATLVIETLRRRLVSPGTWITLTVVLAGAISLMIGRPRGDTARAQVRFEEQTLGSRVSLVDQRAVRFIAWMVILGALLALVPEFFYLRDLFGNRMNTIFKFYFQVWILWSLAAAYFSAVLLRQMRGAAGWVFRAGWLILLAAAMTYPLFMLPAKTQNFHPAAWTLDGSRYLEQIDPAMPEAVDWHRWADLGVLAEGVSESYSYHLPRYSAFSGQPAVLGWPWHEVQWGRADELGSRQQDMQTLFTSRDWQEVAPIVQRYQIRYVIVGPVERAVYNDVSRGLTLQDEKFRDRLPVVFEQPDITIYEVPQAETAFELGNRND